MSKDDASVCQNAICSQGAGSANTRGQTDGRLAGVDFLLLEFPGLKTDRDANGYKWIDDFKIERTNEPINHHQRTESFLYMCLYVYKVLVSGTKWQCVGYNTVHEL